MKVSVLNGHGQRSYLASFYPPGLKSDAPASVRCTDSHHQFPRAFRSPAGPACISKALNPPANSGQGNTIEDLTRPRCA